MILCGGRTLFICVATNMSRPPLIKFRGDKLCSSVSFVAYLVVCFAAFFSTRWIILFIRR